MADESLFGCWRESARREWTDSSTGSTGTDDEDDGTGSSEDGSYSSARPAFAGRIPNGRGERLALHTWKPRGGHARGVALLFHGYLGSPQATAHCHLAQALCHMGLRCYGADMIGHGDSDGIPGLLPNTEELFEDGLDVLAEVQARHPDLKIFVCGMSMGGGVAVYVAHYAQQPVDGVVLLSPLIKPKPSDLPHPAVVTALRALSQVAPSWAVGPLPITDFEEDRGRFEPYQGRMRLRTASTLLGVAEWVQDSVEDFSCPFFIGVGTRDKVVDRSGPKEFFERTSTDEPDKTFRRYAGASHVMLTDDEEIREDVLRDICRWIAPRLRG